MKQKMTILISDDSRMNRELLSSMLEEQYEIVETENGAQAVELLREDAGRFSAFLLDIQMPEMDGFEVLAYMNRYHWIEDLPVIIISSETSVAYIERAYNLGATDYIPRPFEEAVVLRRIQNTILLNSKQRQLTNIVVDQLRERRKSDRLMISILSHIVEFRNGESGLHVMRVHTITKMLLEQLRLSTDRYKLSHEDINLISTVSALHDIGKISIPDEILNKPGKYTPEEFEIMKGHAAAGGDMLKNLPFADREPLIKVAYEVCRWHHERYDGKGYPDGLKGDEIPVSAQVVALADVYDALTSERCYKSAYTHSQSMEMILDGQCGAFNPVLLDCLTDIGDALKQKLSLNSPSILESDEEEYGDIAGQLSQYGLTAAERHLREQETLRQRLRFVSDQSNEIFFSYDCKTSLLLLNRVGVDRLKLDSTVENPLENERIISHVGMDTLRRFKERKKETTRERPDFQVEMDWSDGTTHRHYRCLCHTVWTEGEDACAGMVCKLTNSSEPFLYEKDCLVISLKDYQREVYTDAVTGGKNRRYYNEKMAHLHCTCGVAMIDVNNFKNVNDTYGHQIGDLMLKQVSERLSGCMSENDSVMRYGGDEFIAIFPDISSETFVRKVENMVESVKTAVVSGYEQLRISISVGGIYGPGVVSEMVDLADALMYQAKMKACGFEVRCRERK